MESENTDKHKEKNKGNKGSKKGKQVATKTTVNIKNEDGGKPARIKYKKRGGTSGATGQLFESKLLSLVLFRCLTDIEIEEFLLGSNVVGVGDLDDICLRFSYKGKEIAAFIQSKHKDDSSKGFTDIHLYSAKSKVNLLKCFDSYLQTRNQFNTQSDKKDIFRGNFEDVEITFIVYTSAVKKISKEKNKIIDESDWFSKLRKIVSCKDCKEDDVFQLAYDENDVKIVSNVLIDERIEILAKGFVDCLIEKEVKNFEVFNKYLNILVPDVVNIAKNEACNVYVANINPNLFYATDEIIIKLRQSIFKFALANTELNKEQQDLSLNIMLYGESNDDKSRNLKKIIGNTIIFDDKSNKLIFNSKAPQSLVTKYEKRLNYFNYYFHEITKNMIDEAIRSAGEDLLLGTSINIPMHIIDITELKEYSDKRLFFAEETRVAEDFLNKLYFFTNQGQEKNVADKLVSEMTNHFQQLDNQCFQKRIGADIAFLKFHDKVQKWWLLSNNSFYQQKSCEYLNQLPNEIALPFIDVLDFKYRHEINKHSVKFKPESKETIKFNSKSKITNVVTRSLLLTSIKLQQFFNNFIYIDFQHLYYLRDSEWATLKEELKSKKDFNLMVVCKNVFENASETFDIVTWLLGKVIDAFTNNIVILSNDSLNIINNDGFLKINDVYTDENITFADLTVETQDQLLQYEIDFQGQIVLFKQLLGNDSSIINTDIIHRILEKKNIVLGHNLSNSSYENIKELYVPRTLVSRNEFENMKPYDYDRYIVPYDSYHNILCSFKDSNKDMNIIAAEPGMGKSTILTHLSVETKKQYPEIWIVRLNLLDYCDDFQNMGIEVNETEFLNLILKSQFGDIAELTVDHVDEVVTFKYNGKDNLRLFEIEMMMYFYNKRNMIFVFDGFDEICPDYQTQVTSFIKNAKDDYNDEGSTFNLLELFHASEIPKRFQVWLTSRPYNVIIQQLEKDFGPSFILKSLTEKEQNYFYEKYWSANFKANEINAQQFKNIESFFDFMSQFRSKLENFSDHFHANEVPLYEMYISAVSYFRNLILYMPIEVDKEKLLSNWITDKTLRLKLAKSSLTRGTDMNNAQQIVGVPLYMDMAANYFVSEIKNDKHKSPTEWDLGFTTFGYYKRFVELKLKRRFVEKNEMKISKPDVKDLCNTERDNFMDTHKKLAFYAMMHRSKYYLKRIISKQEMLNIKKTIERIKNGKEKTGLIERIHNGIPRFVHLTFAEYFAVEFIVDQIIAKKPNLRIIMDYILNYLLRQGTIGLRTIFDQKLRINDKQLNEVLSQPAVKKIVFDLMIEQKDKTELTISSFEDVETVNIEPSLDKAIDNDLNNVVMFLISSLDGNLNVENIDTVIEFFGRGYFIGTMLMNRPELIEYVLNQIRRVDESKIKKVISVCKIFIDTNKEIHNVDILCALYDETKDCEVIYNFDDLDEPF